jgi:hypothetical protein
MLDSAPTFGGIKDGLFNSKASLLTGDARRAASAPFGADLARDRPPDPLNAPDPPAAGTAPGRSSPFAEGSSFSEGYPSQLLRHFLRPVGRFHKVHRGRCPFRTFRCRSGNRRWRLLLVGDLS